MNHADFCTGDLAVARRDELCSAVIARLPRMANEGRESDCGPSAVRLGAGVLECAGALKQIGASLAKEVGLRHRF